MSVLMWTAFVELLHREHELIYLMCLLLLVWLASLSQVVSELAPSKHLFLTM